MNIEDITEKQAKDIFHKIVRCAGLKGACIVDLRIFLKDDVEVDDIPVFYQFENLTTRVNTLPSLLYLDENTWKDALKKLLCYSSRGAVVGWFKDKFESLFDDGKLQPLVPIGSTFESVMISLDLKGI